MSERVLKEKDILRLLDALSQIRKKSLDIASISSCLIKMILENATWRE